jgi:hypothetical protein
MTLYANHLGFTPSSAKYCLLGGPLETSFEVKELTSAKTVFQGSMQLAPGDIGIYTLGDFSDLRTPGEYFLEAGRERSFPFRIGEQVYEKTLQDILGYFRLQRCGDTQTGWNGPCHLDDGLRADTRQRQDVEGGWHDANDLRKWVSATLFGMLGLLRLAEASPPGWHSAVIVDELRWGNRYFLKMQEPAGYIMNHCGGDYFIHSDNNRWTDNLSDGRDDRLIDTRPCDTLAQWLFVLVEAGVTRRVQDGDPAYARTCEAAARRCLSWLLEKNLTGSAGELGIALAALVELYRLKEDPRLQEQALAFADRLLRLQVTRQEDSLAPVWGFFWERDHPSISSTALEPYKSIWQGCWPLLGLVSLRQAFPSHPQASAWENAIYLFCNNYLQAMAGRNAFGIVPYGLFRSRPGSDRQAGKFWYRYFYPENPDWVVGINANLASTGVGLLLAGKHLGEPAWTALAQRQLDWILGVNTFNASTVMGSGHNNPQHMFSGGYYPPTPFLPGAVMNGISGNAADAPQLRPGEYQECEYWTPMVCFTMWLVAEIGRAA